jgi:hypothetical protein
MQSRGTLGEAIIALLILLLLLAVGVVAISKYNRCKEMPEKCYPKARLAPSVEGLTKYQSGKTAIR